MAGRRAGAFGPRGGHVRLRSSHTFSEASMIRTTRRVVAAALAILCAAVCAQDFPNKPIRIIVPTSVATTSDLTARFVAEEMAREFGVNVVVDNRAGANGIVGITQFLAAPPDGHTLLVTYSGLYANPALYKSVPYDPVRDFRILAGLNQVLLALVAAPTFNVASVRQLIDYAKERPGEVTYASAGAGSSTHLGPELLASRAGIRLRHVSYKGGAQAIADTAGGHVQIAMTALPTALPLVAGGKLKALAVTGSFRSGVMPDVPTLAEAGIGGAEITSKQAMVAPAGIPEAIAARLTASLSRIVRTPQYARMLEASGVEKEPLAPEAYSKIGAEELRRWTEMVRLSGAKFD
ncbi:MAG: tripartite tricarboxylate transporter substrate binding protein [Burkholderiales bacterium]|nr:tripartite tricarboxylate transporter substrate binding protein [Burkholderiales bacterium]